MSIRRNLYILIILFGLALLINLAALGFLVRTATSALTTANAVLQQQSAALRMQAQLRDAEAALYRYEIEGETGFATHFQNQLNFFEREVGNYEQLVQTPNEQIWVAELYRTHQESVRIGGNLLQQRALRSQDLKLIERIQADIAVLLTGPLREVRSDDLQYQRVLSGMSVSLQEMLFALISYLSAPKEIDRVRFVDSISSFRSYYRQFKAQVDEVQAQTWAVELAGAVDEIERLGAQLISSRIQQKADFANFALLLFRTGQGIIVDEIQPQAASNIAQAQAALNTTIRYSILITLITAAITLALFVSITLPLLNRMNRSIMALLRGADSVAAGDLTAPVKVAGQHEFQRLATAFNKMMEDLGTRETQLRELLQKLSLVQEEERQLVGLDLHDGLTQMLLSANMHFNAFASKFQVLTQQALTEQTFGDERHQETSATAETQFNRGWTRLKEAIEEVRWVVSELRPTELADYGLIDGMHHYVNKVAEFQQWQVVFEADLGDHQLQTSSETAIFRIVQEALSNARKYAQTEWIQVSLHTDDTHIHLMVKDWGQGFVPPERDGTTSHLGVTGMEERTKLIGGTFALESQLDVGTCIQVDIPLADNVVSEFVA